MHTSDIAIDQIEQEITRLNYRCARILDDDRLEEWPGLFVDDCKYAIHPRDNYVAGLEGYWLYLDNHAMLRDRVKSLREANLYNIHQDRRIVTGVMFDGEQDGVFHARSSFLILQSDVEGRGRFFCTGEYLDKMVFSGGVLKFKERIVVPDSFNMHGLVAVPL
ncbi:aromatic-ring-hydroxylating dioxygenase subunit beta [Pusillimonas sp. T2]|uniref:aromatic-ring-hydroxylating dioxygenase subunit beta n=1 Tax=Pusillimonas sp. T2 TaxID=1548123 RepID=UPI0013033927|nr:aromatic-ring-hydroxylating dioxygenase subunit beta [Pusillimonas sp. T2]